MDIKISERKEEPMLSRSIVNAEVIFDKATPSNKDIKSKLAGALKTDEKCIVIKHIYTSFGDKKAKVIAYAYQNEDQMKKIEPKEKKEKPKNEEGA